MSKKRSEMTPEEKELKRERKREADLTPEQVELFHRLLKDLGLRLPKRD